MNESVTVSAERPLYSDLIDGGMTNHRVDGRFQEPVFASQVSGQAESGPGASGITQTWDAKNPMITNFTVKSRDPGYTTIEATGSQGPALELN